MSKTPMCTNLLETFQIFTKFVIKQIRHHLSSFTIFYILLSVKKPIWDFVLSWISHYRTNSFQLFFSYFSCTFSLIDICLLQN